MSYVKLDSAMLNSTLWIDRNGRDVFITALLMAVPRRLPDTPEIATRSTTRTGWVVPAGEYGFVEASGPGICRQEGIDFETGMEALERLASPDPESRSTAFEGRRLVRVDGGYVVLNYMAYRDKDHTAAGRQRAYRDRQRNAVTSQDHTVTSRRNPVRPSPVTEAEAEADKHQREQALSKIETSHAREARAALASPLKADGRIEGNSRKAEAYLDQWHREGVTPAQLERAIRIARVRKPPPELIPGAYLAPIVADVLAGRAVDPEPDVNANIREAMANMDAKAAAATPRAPAPARAPEPPAEEPAGVVDVDEGGFSVDEESLGERPWWRDEDGILAAGAEASVVSIEGEDFADYAARVMAARGHGPWLAEQDAAMRARIAKFVKDGVNPQGVDPTTAKARLADGRTITVQVR